MQTKVIFFILKEGRNQNLSFETKMNLATKNVGKTLEIQKRQIMEEKQLKKKSSDDDIKSVFSTSAFGTLDREFNEVLHDLESDPALSQFRIEYEKLYRNFKKSYNQEKRLVKRCRELNAEIVTNAAKVQTAIRLTQDDQITISKLEKENESAWAMVDNLQEKEIRANETASELQKEAERLSELIDNLKKKSLTQDKHVKELSSECEELRIDLRKKTSAKVSLEGQLREGIDEMESIRSQKHAATESLVSMEQKYLASREETMKNHEKYEEALKANNDIKLQLENITLHRDELKYTHSLSEDKASQLEKQLSQAKSTMEKYLKDYDTLYQQELTLSEDHEKLKKKNTEITHSFQNCQQQLKLSKSEYTRLSSYKNQVERNLDQEKKGLLRFKAILDDTKKACEISQNEVLSLKKEIDEFKTQEHKSRRNVDILNQEKNLHLNKIQRTEKRVKYVDDAIRQQENLTASLQKELVKEREKVIKCMSTITRLEKKCEKIDVNCIEVQERNSSLKDDIRLREIEMQDLKNKLFDKENGIARQKKISDELRSENNRISQQLIEYTSERTEMKNQENLLDQQIKQLRNELATKEETIVREHFDWKREKSKGDHHRNEISKLKGLLSRSNESIHKQDVEIKRYENILRKMNENAFMQRKEYDQIMHERDILGTQLIRRNDELALLYEKLKILQNILLSGEMQYQTRIEDIRLLKLKIKDMQRQATIAKGGAVNMDDIARELIQKHRELLREKNKVKALSEELESPMNIHRWRKLEGSDPATYEMIQKIQILQKRLIKKTEEVRIKYFKTFVENEVPHFSSIQ